MTKRTFRSTQIVLLFITFIVIVSSFYFQYMIGLEPCPLCLMQRFSAIVLGMFYLMGICISTIKRSRIVCVFQIILAAFGLFFATRQLWLQSLPVDETPVCMPGLDVLIQYFPWKDVLHALFWGSGDCANVSWSWLGLSMPAWSALYFIFMLIASFVLLLRLTRTLKLL